MPSGPKRNPFDTAVMPGRPLAERITVPGGRRRSLSPHHASDEEAARRGIDRYRPGARGSRSRSPLPSRRREGGRRAGGRREGGGGGGGRGRGGRRGGGDDGAEKGGERTARDGRPRKTQEELDAEMEDYFNGGGGGAQQQNDAAPTATNGAAQQQDAGGDDIDMIE